MPERNLCSQGTRISLVSLVMSIISLISCKKRNYTSYFWGGFFRRVVVFGGMATFRDLWNVIATYGRSLLLELFGLFASLETRGNWAEFSFAETSGTVTRDREKNWPIADQRVPSNHPRNNCGMHFGSISLLVSKVVNCHGISEFVWRRSVYLLIGRFPFN